MQLNRKVKPLSCAIRIYASPCRMLVKSKCLKNDCNKKSDRCSREIRALWVYVKIYTSWIFSCAQFAYKPQNITFDLWWCARALCIMSSCFRSKVESRKHNYSTDYEAKACCRLWQVKLCGVFYTVLTLKGAICKIWPELHSELSLPTVWRNNNIDIIWNILYRCIV